MDAMEEFRRRTDALVQMAENHKGIPVDAFQVAADELLEACQRMVDEPCEKPDCRLPALGENKVPKA